MRLTSVRDLKQELSSGPALTPTIMTARGWPSRSAAVSARAHALHVRAPQSSEVALGLARGKNKNDFLLAARVQAETGAEEVAERIIQRSSGECDVRLVPKIEKRTPISFFRGRRRPLEAGLSLGVVLSGMRHAGTLGFIVEDEDTYYALSNNHVLADINSSEPGDPVTQPGTLDRAASTQTLVGVLDRYVPISFQRSNVVDCAVAELFPQTEFFQGWTEAIPGQVAGVHTLTIDDLGRKVKKAGRTTGVTEGTITSVELDRLRVDMGVGVASFSDQAEFIGKDGRSFSAAGDSGALIVNEDRKAVALLFAGGPDDTGIDRTYANLIGPVLAKLGVALVI